MSDTSTNVVQIPLYTHDCATECQLVEFQRRQYEKARLNVIRARMAETEMEYRTREVIDGALHLLQKPLNVIQAMAHNMERQICKDKSGMCLPMDCAMGEAMQSGNAAKQTLRLSVPAKRQAILGPVNVNEAIRDCLVIMADELAANGIVVDWRATSDLPMIYGDEIGLRILLRILIENAITAVGQEGAKGRDVSIQSRIGSDGFVEVCVNDTGPGISRSMRNKIFEPFYTAWNKNIHRSGMGLAIAHQILNDLYGEIEIRDHRGAGSRFCITLPIC